MATAINLAAVDATWRTTADTLGRDPEELAADVVRDPAQLRISQTALAAAGTTYDERKIRLLANVLAEGLEDEALLDVSWLIASALRDIEAPHVRVLHVIKTHGQWSWPHNIELGEGSDAIIATLVRHGLVKSSSGFGGEATSASPDSEEPASAISAPCTPKLAARLRRRRSRYLVFEPAAQAASRSVGALLLRGRRDR